VAEVPAMNTTAVPPFNLAAMLAGTVPPWSDEPQVTTEPSSFNATNALSVEKMLTTFVSSPLLSWTADESPPKLAEPQVTTLLFSFNAANACWLENTCSNLSLSSKA